MTAKTTGVSTQTVAHLYQGLRDVCTWKLKRLEGAGPDAAIQIHELSPKRKPKYHRAAHDDQLFWEEIFGKEDMFDNILLHISQQYPV